MKQLFLTSSVHAVAHDIAKRVALAKGNKLVFIDTAAEAVEEDKEWLISDRKALVDAGFGVTDFTITDKPIDQLRKDLGKYDFIYISGGDTKYLLKQSQKTGFISLVKELILRENKTYIGTSAGSIIAGPKVPDYLFGDGKIPEDEKQKGYGFVNFTVVPHWGSEDFKERYLKKRLKIAYRKDQVPLLLLTDTQYVHVQGKQMRIIEVGR